MLLLLSEAEKVEELQVLQVTDVVNKQLKDLTYSQLLLINKGKMKLFINMQKY